MSRAWFEPYRKGGSMASRDQSTARKSQATAISDAIGALHREHYGRGADQIRTMIHRDVVATTLEDCYTPVEKRMIAEGQFAQVRETRTMFQDWMCERFIAVVEEGFPPGGIRGIVQRTARRLGAEGRRVARGSCAPGLDSGSGRAPAPTV